MLLISDTFLALLLILAENVLETGILSHGNIRHLIGHLEVTVTAKASIRGEARIKTLSLIALHINSQTIAPV